MTCSKCGFEFEGNTCPRCNAPAILVNSSDYERRKREWEERERQQENLRKKKQKEQDDIRQMLEQVSVRSNEALKAMRAKRRKIALGLFAVVLLVAAALVIAGLVGTQKSHLYVADGVNIFQDANFDTAYCSQDSVIYTWDASEGYVEDIPAEINRNQVIGTCASPSGKYYGAVAYVQQDEANGSTPSGAAGGIGESSSTAVNGNSYGEGTYTLYVWDRDGSLETVFQGNAHLGLLYVGDGGELLYAQTAYLNEGLVGSQSIYARGTDGSIVRLVSNPQEYLLCGGLGKFIWIDENKILYIADITSGAGEAHAIRAGRLYGQGDSDYFVYSTEDYEYISHDLGDDTERYLFTLAENAVDVFYGEGTGRAYAVSQNCLWQFSGIPTSKSKWGKDRKERVSEQLASGVAAGNYLYDHVGNELVYIDGDGNLTALCARGTRWKESVLSTGVAQGVSRLAGTEGGVVYSRDGVTYYRKGVKYGEHAVETASRTDAGDGQGFGVSGSRPSQVAYYNDRLYYVMDGSLYSDRTAGEALNIDSVGSLWVGSIHR